MFLSKMNEEMAVIAIRRDQVKAWVVWCPETSAEDEYECALCFGGSCPVVLHSLLQKERERLQKLVGECQESRSKKSKKGYSKVPRLFIGVFRRCWHYVEHEGRRPKQESKTLCKSSSTMRSIYI